MGNLDRGSAGERGIARWISYSRQQTILVVVTHSAMLADKFPIRFELVDRQLRPVG